MRTRLREISEFNKLNSSVSLHIGAGAAALFSDVQ